MAICCLFSIGQQPLAYLKRLVECLCGLEVCGVWSVLLEGLDGLKFWLLIPWWFGEIGASKVITLFAAGDKSNGQDPKKHWEYQPKPPSATKFYTCYKKFVAIFRGLQSSHSKALSLLKITVATL